MDIRILVLTIFRLLLGMIFLVSSVSKVSAPRRFANTLIAFRLIPNSWAQPFAIILIGAEAIIAALLLIGWQSRISAGLCGFLLVIFTVAIGLNIIRGRTDLECGCFGLRHAQQVNFNLVGRNVLLLSMAICIMLWGGGLLALDNHPLVWKRLFAEEILLPGILACAGTLFLILLIRQLYRLLLVIYLEE